MIFNNIDEVVPDSERVATVALDYRGDVFATKQVSYGPPESPWQRCDSATTFGHEIVIPDIAPGMHIFNAVTKENAAGETGRAFAYLFIGEEEDPPQPVTLDYPLEIAFTNAPTTNMLDAAFVQCDANYAMLEISNSVPDIRWEGAASDGSQLMFAAIAPLSNFSAYNIDVFTAAVRRVTYAGATNDFAAVMQETSANSLLFAATYCFESEVATHPVILSTGTIEGTPSGYIEPFIAKIVSPTLSDAALTNLLSAKGWIFNLHGEPMRVISVEGLGLCLTDVESTNDEPRIFTALADRAGTVPAEAWGERYITFELASTNGTTLVEYDSWITDPSFADDSMQVLAAGYSAPPQFVGPPLQLGGDGMLMSATASVSSPADWTVEDMWAMFEILFGDAGRVGKTRYLSFGGTVLKQEAGLYGSYSCHKFDDRAAKNEKPYIILDNDIANAVDAAVAMHTALSARLNSIWLRYDFKQHMADDILGDFANNPNGAAEYEKLWKNGLDHLKDAIIGGGNLVEIGVSIAPTPLAIVIDISNVVDEWKQGKRGSAATSALFAFIGGISDVKQAGKALRLKTGSNSFMDLTDDFAAVVKGTKKLKLSERPELMKTIREKLKDGTMTREQVELLYDGGKLDSSGGRQGVLRKFAVDASQGAGKTEIHHDFPHMYERQFLSIGLDPNTMGRKLPYDIHKKLHSAGGGGGVFNHQWGHFFEPLTNKDFIDPLDGLPRVDLTNPAESAEEFLKKLLEFDINAIRGARNITELDWPYKMITK